MHNAHLMRAVYVNSLLATLNARGSILGRGARRRRASVAGKEIAFPTTGNTTDTGRDGGSGAFDLSVHGAGIEVCSSHLCPGLRSC